MLTEIYIIEGVEGKAVALGDYRVAGPKPWGGGKIVKKWHVSVKDILCALNNIYNPAHQPKKTELEELTVLTSHIYNAPTLEDLRQREQPPEEG